MKPASRASPGLAAMLLFAMLPLPAGAGDGPPPAALVARLETWLDRKAPYPRRAAVPEIRLIGPAEARARQHRAPFPGARPRGFYDPEGETVYLVRPWHSGNPRDVSVLLHELAHHRQKTAGHWYCPGAQELPAYRLQRDWLAERGLGLEVNWIAVVLEAGCSPRDIHPD